jgi:lysophospholipase L1-like esterase
LLYLIIDGCFGWINPIKPYARQPERLTAVAYQKEPYFSEEFLCESFRQPGGWNTPKGTRLIFPNEFHGKYFNVDVLPPVMVIYRRTLNQSSTSSNIKITPKKTKIILMLGGSTMYSSEVPDALTIPSILANILNKHISSDHPYYFIYNAGVTSVNSIQELERLEFELHHGLKPDLVILYDGINDVVQGVYYGNPQGVMFSDAMRSRIKELLKKIIPLNIYHYFREHAKASNLRELPVHMNNLAVIRTLAKQTQKVYRENLLKMKELARENKFRLIVILQPHVFFEDSHPTADRTAARKLSSLRTPKIEKAFSVTYPLLRKTITDLKSQHFELYDFSQIFVGLQDEVFLDPYHINSRGNYIIAMALSKIILAANKN